jgi:glycosyltransferase involved in cell wall biosynthesis
VKILQLCPRIPYPPVDGGTIGMFNLSNALISLGMEVKVLAFNTSKHFIEDDQIDAYYRTSHKLEWVYLDNSVKPFKALLNLFSSQSYNIVRFYSEEFSSKLKQLLASGDFDMVQLDYLTMALYINDIREVSSAKIILRAHNVEHRIWKRLAAEEKNPLKRWYLSMLAKRLHAFERKVLTQIDALVTLTDEETKIFRELGYDGPVCVAPTCFSIDELPVSSASGKFSLFHLGAMDWRPNLEGMQWFLDRVWPRIKERWNSIELYIAGNNMPEKFFNYADDQCTVEGRIPDARAYMSRHSVMIVPLLAGSGIRVKIVEGMALGKAIISTSQGAEGLHYRHMENIIIADSEQQMIDAVDLCYNNPDLMNEIGSNARKLAEDYYDMKKVGAKVLNFYAEISASSYIYKT